jgi:hypothetical protein
MNVLRTPDERFAALAGYPFAPQYLPGASAPASLVQSMTDCRRAAAALQSVA